MVYEIEKRSLLTNDQFENLKSILDKDTKFIGVKEFKSFLFQKPTFLRIRLVKGKDIATITEKTGTYDDIARTEINKDIVISDLPNYIKEIQSKGYSECSEVYTKRTTYSINNLKLELNDISHLGLIVEIEALTENESEIQNLNKEVIKTMKRFKLKELDSKEYQMMMNNMYKTTLKPADDHKFIFD